MPWSTIRKATPKDIELLENRAISFCERHAIEIPEDGFDSAIDCIWSEIDFYWLQNHVYAVYLRKLWLAVVRRAFRHKQAEGIAYGFIGFSTERLAWQWYD